MPNAPMRTVTCATVAHISYAALDVIIIMRALRHNARMAPALLCMLMLLLIFIAFDIIEACPANHYCPQSLERDASAPEYIVSSGGSCAKAANGVSYSRVVVAAQCRDAAAKLPAYTFAQDCSNCHQQNNTCWAGQHCNQRPPGCTTYGNGVYFAPHGTWCPNGCGADWHAVFARQPILCEPNPACPDSSGYAKNKCKKLVPCDPKGPKPSGSSPTPLLSHSGAAAPARRTRRSRACPRPTVSTARRCGAARRASRAPTCTR